MKYKFPHITHLTEVKDAIQGRDEFVVADRDWGYVVNYLVNFVDTFDVKSDKDLIKRECRGIKFDREGNIIARPYHKFFNLNEREETQDHTVDFDKKFIILEKLDGSMIHPILIDGQVVYCTKMGPTDIAVPVQKFADRGIRRVNGKKERVWYNDFSYDLMKSGYTPIFEWCSRSQRIVIEYPEDNLVLTGVRNMVTGEYKTYSQLEAMAEAYRVPVVNHYAGDFNGINDFVKNVQEREGEEGYVIRFRDGHMLKIKNLWYLQLHKTKELMQNEKDVWAVILDDKVDDARAFMEEDDQKRLSDFQEKLVHAIEKKSSDLYWDALAWRDNKGESKKRFAVEFVNAPNSKFAKNERGLMFKIWDSIENGDDEQKAYSIVHDYIRSQLGSYSKLDAARNLAGNLQWSY